MLELLDRTKDEDLMIIEVLGKGNPAKNTFTELKKVTKDPQSIFYIGVPKGQDFLTSVSAMAKTNEGNRYILPKESGKPMERYKELGKLGQDIHDLLNETVDKQLASANKNIELEEEDEEILAELRRSNKENTLLHLLRKVYRSMTGQVLDIGAGKELQRKFKEERAKRIKRIKEMKERDDSPEPITEEQRQFLEERRRRLEEEGE